MQNPSFDENEVLRDALTGLNEDVPPMPEGLHAAWMQQVEEDKMEKTLTRKTVTRFLSIAAALVFVVGGTLLTRDDLDSRAVKDAEYAAVVAQNDSTVLYADSAADYSVSMSNYAPEADTNSGAAFTMSRSTSAPAAASGSAGAALTGKRSVSGSSDEPVEVNTATDKKIIRTASLTICTQTYDMSLDNLRALCEADGGWIESIQESGSAGSRWAMMTLRIPQEALDGYLSGAEQLGRITMRSETATDVTAQYQDTQTRLNTQLALMDRLQALIPESASLTDLLALEAQIADTQYQIDTLTASLANTDRQVSYATVRIQLCEETIPSITDASVSLGERLLSGLRLGWDILLDFTGDMLVFIVAALPFIAIVAVVVILTVITRKIRRNKE